MCIIGCSYLKQLARNIMDCSTKTKILRVLNLIVILSLCIWVKYKHDKVKEMINWNTKIINSIGVVSFTQSQNADVLLGIINELDGQEIEMDFDGGQFISLNQDDLKPEPQLPPMPEGMEDSYVQKPFSTFEVDKDGIEEIPATFNQVIEDLRRIDVSVRAFASNNLFQKQSLDLIYQKISSGRKELEELNEEDIYYIMADERHKEELVKLIADKELEGFQWCFVDSNDTEENE